MFSGNSSELVHANDKGEYEVAEGISPTVFRAILVRHTSNDGWTLDTYSNVHSVANSFRNIIKPDAFDVRRASPWLKCATPATICSSRATLTPFAATTFAICCTNSAMRVLVNSLARSLMS